MRRSILIITSSYPRKSGGGAAGVFIREFALSLSEFSDVYVFTQSTKEGPKIDKEIEVVTFPWGDDTPLSLINPFSASGIKKASAFFLYGLTYLERFLKNKKIDFIFSMWAVPAGIFGLYAKYLHNIRYGVWALGSDIWVYGKSKVFKPFVSFILKKADLIYADGRSLLREVESLAKKRCKLLIGSRNLKECGQKRRLERVILFVGRYHRNKGPDILLNSFLSLKKKLNGVKLFMFGEGPLRDELFQFVRENGLEDDVKIHDYIEDEDLSFYLENVDLLVIPSRFESIPIIFSDALQKKLKMVATEVSDLRDFFYRFKLGHLAKVDSQSIEQAILSSIFCKTFGRRGKVLYEDLLSSRNMVLSFLSDLKSVENGVINR